ncbi:unnamed protein product [Adineta steineri]|uniref:Uncharacterized protein n=1 Tax=Adineta steineri TaxID=433720 RepID=A0A815E4R3_9BILA|nr:unnamed protein product [Adineta steineri]CAF1577934.1 unnamed protein product [Adineta steineri]
MKQDYVVCVSCKSLISHKTATGTSGIHYAGIGLHNSNEQFKLLSFALCYRAYELESQTSVNVRRFVNSILKEYGLPFNDSNRIGCSDHYLNKIFEKTFTGANNLEVEEA